MGPSASSSARRTSGILIIRRIRLKARAACSTVTEPGYCALGARLATESGIIAIVFVAPGSLMLFIYPEPLYHLVTMIGKG